MTLTNFLFAYETGANPDPLWFIAFVAGISLFFIFVGTIGRKVFKNSDQKAVFKVLKKSNVGLKVFGCTYLMLLWFRLEAVGFLSMKFWWILTTIILIWFAFTKVRYFLKLTERIQKGKQERSEHSNKRIS